MNKSIVLLAILLCFLEVRASKKYGRSLVQMRRNDGFNLFGGTYRRDRKDIDRDFIFRNYGKAQRRNNLVTARKWNQFSSNAMQSLSSFIKNIFSQQQPIKKGTKRKSKTFVRVQDEGFDWYSILIISFCGPLGFSLIYYVLVTQPFTAREQVVMRKWAQERDQEKLQKLKQD